MADSWAWQSSGVGHRMARQRDERTMTEPVTPPGRSDGTADPGIRRPQEALRDPEPLEDGTTDPAVLARQVRRSALDDTTNHYTSAPAAPRVPAGGSDPTVGGDDPAELARLIQRHRY